MTDLARLEKALVAADAAGDTAAAQQIAAEIRRVRSQPVAEPQQAPQGAFRDFAAGTNRGLAGLAGLPVDAVTGALNAFLPEQAQIRSPFGGAESIERGLSAVGINSKGPRNFPGIAGEYLATAPLTGAFTAARAGLGVAGGVAKEGLSGLLAAGGGYAASQAFPGNPLAEMAGALTPGAMRAGLAAVARPVVRGVPAQTVREGVDLANRVGAPVTAAAAVPSKPVQAMAGASSAVPGGVSIFKQAGDDAAAALRQRVSTIVGGEADDVARAGRTVSRGLFDDGGFVSRFKAKGNQLYSAMDAKIPANTPVPASNTYTYLNSANKGVQGAPNMSARMFVDDALQQNADAFFKDIYDNGGSIPYEALKKFRTQIGDALADPDLIGSEQRATLKKLYGALSEDMADIAARKGATKEFDRANKYYAAGTKRIEDFFESLDRKVSGEDIYKAVLGDNPQSATKILTLKKSLTPDEWNYVRRTFVTRMGRPVASAASEAGTGFSPVTFLTNYEKAKRNGVATAIFGTGQFRKDLDDVAKYTSNLKGAADILANPSGTAARGLTGSVLFGALGLPGAAATGLALGGGAGAVAGAAVGLGSIGTAVLANRKIAKMLNSPEFVHWLAQSTRVPPARMPGHIARLTTIAQNDPEMAEILADYATAIGQ
jgi:hypothetical protein